MRPGGVASRVACAAATRPPPRTLGAALPGRIRTLPIDSGSMCTDSCSREWFFRENRPSLRWGNCGGNYPFHARFQSPAKRGQWLRAHTPALSYVHLLPESAGSVLIRPGKAAKSARGGGLVAAAHPTHSLPLAGGNESTAARADQGLPADPG